MSRWNAGEREFFNPERMLSSRKGAPWQPMEPAVGRNLQEGDAFQMLLQWGGDKPTDATSFESKRSRLRNPLHKRIDGRVDLSSLAQVDANYVVFFLQNKRH